MKKYLLLLLAIALVILQKATAQTPVAYYPFSGNANDAIGTNNGTVNGATLTTDRFGTANSAYSFDGVDDFIDLGSLNFANADYTISFWVNLNSAVNDNTVFSGAAPAVLTNTFILSEIDNGIGRFLHRNPAGTTGGVDLSGVQSFPISTWKFVTCVKQATTLRYYVNGLLDNSVTNAASTNISSAIFIELGRLRNGANTFIRHLNGKLDEVKIFNTALTAAQVLAEYNNSSQSPIPQTNLKVWLRGDDGITKDINNKVSVWSDQSVNGNSATQILTANQPMHISNAINGHAVIRYNSSDDYFRTNYKGPNTNAATIFVVAQGSNISSIVRFQNTNAASSGYLIYGYTHIGASNGFCMSNDGGDLNGIDCGFFNNPALQIGSARWKANTTNGMQTFINGSLLAQRNSNNSTLPNDTLIIGTPGAVDENTIGDVAEIIIYDRALTDAERIQVETYLNIKYRVTNNLATSKPSSGNAVSFDGVDDYMKPSTTGYTGIQTYTIEYWVKKNAPNLTSFIWESFGTLTSPSMESNGDADGRFNFFVSGNSAISTGPLNVGQWYHIACVYNKSATLQSLYVNGILKGTNNINSSDAIGSFLTIMRREFSGQQDRFFNGELDEFRVWNTALTQSQIRDRMCRKITSSDALYSNLVAYYNFDEGTSSTAFDATANNNNGTLTNNPARVTSGAAIGNASAHDYVNATKTATLAHAIGENFTVTSTSGNPSGIHIYRVDEQANTLTGTQGVAGNNKYFGVFQVNGTAPQYTGVYNYNGNPGVNAGNENTLALFKRTDNAITTWVNGTATLNTTAKTLTLTGESTEYILGSTGTPLPLNLISFTGNKQNNNALLQWKTANEVNVSHFDVLRSDDGVTFNYVGKVIAASSTYNWTDGGIFNTKQTVLYRLKLVDKDGAFTYSGILRLTGAPITKLTVFPNPVTDVLTVSGFQENGTIRLFTADGRLMQQQPIIAQSTTIDLRNYAKGMYVLQYQFNEEVLTQNIMKQ